MNRVFVGLRVRSWLLIVAFAAVAGLLGVQTGQRTAAAQKDAEKAVDTSASGGIDYARSLSKGFREVSQRVLPSVVLVSNEPTPKQAAPREQAPDDDNNDPLEGSPFGDLFRNNPDLRRFFRDMPHGVPRGGPGGQVFGIGSGVIIDPSGVILTNNHVVEGNGKIIVRLMDGREFPASEVKQDPKSDLAIIRIKGADHLKAAKLGNSDKMEVGDWVLALGDMFGLEGTVTAGKIGRASCRERV